MHVKSEHLYHLLLNPQGFVQYLYTREISYPARAVNQWVIFWIEYCIKELDQPAVFCT